MPEVINFYSVSDEHGCFSNFAPYPVRLGGKVWPTTEHYFQAQKFEDAGHQEAIRKAKSPMIAARMGRDRKKKLRRDWESAKVSVMTDAVRAKFIQHDDLRAVLLGTGDAKLVEHTENDNYWGDGGDGSGRNMLGQVLMRVCRRASPRGWPKRGGVMSNEHEPDRAFWAQVAANVGDAYRPHTGADGVFLFRQKLERRGYDPRKATRLGPALLARAVPWASFLHLNGREFLRVSTYGWPVQCFLCADGAFDLYLVACVPGTEDTEEEVFLTARVSADRLADLEAGRLTPHETFRTAEDGYVLRVTAVAGSAVAVPCGNLRDEELPPRGEPLAGPRPSRYARHGVG